MLRKIVRQWGTIAAMVIVLILFSGASEYFLRWSNFSNVIFGITTSTLTALGLTFVVMVGSFDLSIGLVVTTTSIVTAILVPIVGPFPAAIIGIAVASLIGAINGVLVTYGRLSGIVVTLGVMFILGGTNEFLTNGYQISVANEYDSFLKMGQGRFNGIPIPDFILLIVFMIALWLAEKTKVGHYIEAVGDNPIAAYYSGLRVYGWVIVAFILSAVLSGIGGVIELAISASAQPTGGEGYLLQAFASVFLGATVFGKGRPHITGTLIASLFLGFVNNGMNMVGAPYAMHQLIQGGVLILAVGANAFLNREELHMRFI